jgi:tryptophan-rich sensory protein
MHFFFSKMRATCPAHLSFLDHTFIIIIIIIYVNEYKSWSSYLVIFSIILFLFTS